MDVGKREILIVINSRDGIASYNNIYDDMRDFEESRDRTKWGRRQIELHIKRLLKFGDIVEKLPKVYALTDQGKKRILEEDYTWRYSERKVVEL